MSRAVESLKFCRWCHTQILRRNHRWIHAATGRSWCRAGTAEEAELGPG